MTSAPFFIVGSGRSGSTLLRMILASHSRIAIPPETWYLLPLVAQFSPDRPLDPEARERAIEIIVGGYRWPDMCIDASEFRREVAALREPLLRDVVEIIYKIHLKREGKRRWGDKTPAYIKIVPQLAALFPDALFVHLVRDGRDVAKSFQALGWYGQALHSNTREWIEALDYHNRWCHSRIADRILNVRYEDLVQATEPTVRNICHFIGEELEPQMLSWERQVPRLIPRREMEIHGKLSRKPDPADVARWRREMPAAEVFVAEALMGPHLRGMGYPLKFEAALWAPVLAAVRLYYMLAFPIVDFAVRAIRRVRSSVSGSEATVRASEK